MIWNSLEKAVKSCVFQPLVFLPMIVATIISLVLTNFVSVSMERFLIDMMANYEAFATSNLVAIILNQYLAEVLIVIVSVFVILFVTIVALIAIANFASGKGVVDSIDISVKELGKSFFATIFIILVLFIAGVVFFGVNWIFSLIYSVSPEAVISFLSLILVPIIYFLLAVIFVVKLGFVLPALVKNKIRGAVKESWEFTNDKFAFSFVFVAIILFLTFLIGSIFSNIGVLLELELIFDSIANIVSTTFFALAISYYYFSK